MMLHQEKELSNDSGRPLSSNNFTATEAKWLLYEAVFFAFSVIPRDSCPHLSLFKAPVFTNDYRF